MRQNAKAWGAVAAVMLLTAVGLGAWLGKRAGEQVPLSLPVVGLRIAGTASAASEKPEVDFPPPLLLPSATADPVQMPASTAKRSIDGGQDATAIVPGGVVEGNAVDRMWETNALQAWQGRAKPLTPPNWYITGVVRRGEHTQIIVQFDGDPVPKFFKVGDTLPGGGRLAWVRPDAIGVVTANHKKIDLPVLSSDAVRAPPVKPVAR